MMEENTTREKLITAREFATVLRYNQVYVYQLIKEGKLKAIRLKDGRTIRIPESELTRYLGGRGGGYGQGQG